MLAGGMAAYQYLSTRFARLFALSALLAAFLIGQSRNMLLVLATISLCILLGKRIRRLSGIGGLIGLAALLSPVVISLLISQGEVADRFVGEGIFERNVEARLSLLDEVEVVADRGWLFGRFFGATRAEWRTINSSAPHNHFVSLIVFDGYVGLLYIFSIYVNPILRLGRRPNALQSPEFIWAAAAVVALSFYEGAFSASLAIALAVLHAQRLISSSASIENEKLAKQNRTPHPVSTPGKKDHQIASPY